MTMHRAVDLAAAYCTLHCALALRLDERFSLFRGRHFVFFFPFPALVSRAPPPPRFSLIAAYTPTTTST
jgi:hypothetical protein